MCRRKSGRRCNEAAASGLDRRLTSLGRAAAGVRDRGRRLHPRDRDRSAGFFRAWLCAYLFWLGLPLCGVTLVLVHDLTGGEWMETARPVLDAAIVTMPLATLAGIPAFIGLDSLYSWTHPAPDLANLWYLNPPAFYLRYACYVVLWNLLAAFALLGPRREAEPIAPALSWLSGIALILLAFSASFAAIDWILSLEPKFWSSIFPMIAGAGWFDSGMAIVVLTVVARRAGAATSGRAAHRRSGADPARDDDLLGLCRIHAVPDHLGRGPEERDRLVSAAAMTATGSRRCLSRSRWAFSRRS